MLKKSLAILSLGAFFFAQAQDTSVLRNSMEVYSGTSLNGTAKYNAMAGSMGALGSEASAISANPAAVGVAIASDLSATLNINSIENRSTVHGNTLDYKLNNTDLGNVGGIVAVKLREGSDWKFVNIGVNFTRKSVEDYAEFGGNSNVTFDLSDGDRLIYEGQAFNRLGDLSKMTLALGTNYQNRIYLGAAVNLSGVSLSQWDSAAMSSQNVGETEVFSKQYTPYSEDASGFSASLGVIGKVSDKFRLGASIETPTWWQIERGYQYYDLDPTNDGEFYEKRSFSSPLKGTVSAAYVPNKNLALNVDYTLGLSKPKFGKMSSDAQSEMDDFFSSNYKNVSEVKVGGEYRIDQLRLRAGYGYASNPTENMTLGILDSAGQFSDGTFDNLYTGSRQTLGLGIGYDFRSFYLDAAYNNISSKYSLPYLRGSEAAGTMYFSQNFFFANDDALVGEVNQNQNLFTLTLGWKF